MRIFGLTGGSGSGKTTAAKRFAELGFPVVDADGIGHALLAAEGAAVDAIAEAFGAEMRVDGAIDRARLGARVFSDSEALAQLNAIVHPALFVEVGRQCSAFADAGHADIILDAALLGEAGAKEDWLAGLILVTAPVAVRTQRLVTHRGMDPERAEKQIAAQIPPETKAAFADWIITNEGTLPELLAQVDAIAEEIRGAAVGS